MVILNLAQCVFLKICLSFSLLFSCEWSSEKETKGCYDDEEDVEIDEEDQESCGDCEEDQATGKAISARFSS